jgi:SAM-dependent methyltransferase
LKNNNQLILILALLLCVSLEKFFKNKVISQYSKLLEQYGYNPQSVGWGQRKGKQSIRYNVLSEIGKLNNCSILDVGCGFGDFYGFLKHKKMNVNYFGIDITPGLIEFGKKIYPKANFEVRDFENKKFKQKFDWVFFSGISSAGVNYKIIKKIMKEMYKICKSGIALNFVGGVLDYKTKGIFYSDPEKIYNISKELSNRITLRHDYMPFEFTIYVYKDNSKTSNLVFKNYLKTSNIPITDQDWHPFYKSKKIISSRTGKKQ